MVAMFRAVVMLLVLVGLPAAWVYYGPLPEPAQQVFDRVVEVAKESLEWHQQTAVSADSKATPRYQQALGEAPAFTQVSYEAEETILPTPRTSMNESSENLPKRVGSPDIQDPQLAALAQELEPHFSLLRTLGAAEYSLAQWGDAGDLYRFQCEIAIGENANLTRQFEAINADPLATVRQVVGEVTSWQNARGDQTMWR